MKLFDQARMIESSSSKSLSNCKHKFKHCASLSTTRCYCIIRRPF